MLGRQRSPRDTAELSIKTIASLARECFPTHPMEGCIPISPIRLTLVQPKILFSKTHLPLVICLLCLYNYVFHEPFEHAHQNEAKRESSCRLKGRTVCDFFCS